MAAFRLRRAPTSDYSWSRFLPDICAHEDEIVRFFLSLVGVEQVLSWAVFARIKYSEIFGPGLRWAMENRSGKNGHIVEQDEVGSVNHLVVFLGVASQERAIHISSWEVWVAWLLFFNATSDKRRNSIHFLEASPHESLRPC